MKIKEKLPGEVKAVFLILVKSVLPVYVMEGTGHHSGRVEEVRGQLLGVLPPTIKWLWALSFMQLLGPYRHFL